MFRKVTQVIPAVPFGPPPGKLPPGNFLKRVIGTTDINGKGTKHACEQIDPFILFDEVLVNSTVPLPFHDHPHSGLVANTISIKTNPSMLWDNQRGDYGPLLSQGVFQLSAGHGVIHDEGREMKVDKAAVPVDDLVHSVQVCQIWFNPGVHLPLADSAASLHAPTDLPIVQSGDLHARLLLGQYQGQISPVSTFHATLFLLHCTLPAGASAAIEVPSSHNAFVYGIANVEKQVAGAVFKIGSGEEDQNAMLLRCHDLAIFSSTTKDEAAAGVQEKIWVKNTHTTAMQFIVGAGKPFDKPWVLPC